MTSQPVRLSRVLGFWAVVAYGVGDILGAGIYALVGEIAGRAGSASVIAFGVALAVAGLTALSYGELSRRFPKSGGEAKFCEEGFRSSGIALFVGWLVLCSGIVSMATVSLAFSGYLGTLLPGEHEWLVKLLPGMFLAVLAGINFWGMRQSSAANIVCTLIEVAGLLFVIVIGLVFLLGDGEAAVAVVEAESPRTWKITLQASALAFFAFIGFEDMVNVAEETKRPSRTLPMAILTAVVIAGIIYMIIIWVATSVVSPTVLSESDAPLLEVVKRAAPRFPGSVFVMVALFAVANTALLNFITTSRLLYGMAGQKLVPGWLGVVHAKNRTPARAIVVVFAAAAILAWSGTLGFLAGTTSFLILLTFLAVNVSLILVKRRRDGDGDELSRGFRVPWVLPWLAAGSCLGLIAFVELHAALRALAIVGLGVIAVLVHTIREKRAR